MTAVPMPAGTTVQIEGFSVATALHPQTLEDVANPHDFPELADPDWQYADGVLAGVQSVLAAVRARMREAGA